MRVLSWVLLRHTQDQRKRLAIDYVKTFSILTPCFNEEGNVREVYERARAAVAAAGDDNYEHIFIDNASTDNTLSELKAIASGDKNVKVIRNTRNFGHVHLDAALYQTSGDVVIGIVADLQDPPEMIVEMIRKWEEGYPVVICVKTTSGEGGLMFGSGSGTTGW